MSGNPFEALDLSTEADEEAIRRAYARAVRRHPPERDPGRFEVVRRAFEALIDPVQRASWVAQVRDAGLPARLLAEAREQLLFGEPASAVARARRALVLCPEWGAARTVLARAELSRRRFRECIREADRALRLGGGSEALEIAVRSRRLYASQPGSPPRRVSRLGREALALLEQGPAGDATLALERARVFLLLELPERALDCLETTKDMEDGPAARLLVQAMAIHLDRRDGKAAREALAALEDRCCCSNSTLAAGGELVLEMQRRAREGRFHGLGFLLDAAERIGPSSPLQQAELARLHRLQALLGERRRIPTRLRVLRRLLGLEVEVLRLHGERTQKEALGQWSAAFGELMAVPPDELRWILSRVRRRCPVFFALKRKLLERLWQTL